MIAAVSCGDERYRQAMEFQAGTARRKGGADRVYQYLISDIDPEFRKKKRTDSLPAQRERILAVEALFHQQDIKRTERGRLSGLLRCRDLLCKLREKADPGYGTAGGGSDGL